MDVLEILESLQSLGVTVHAVGPDRLRLEPASKIPLEMVSRIRVAKAAILEALRNRPATCAPSCYEIEPGCWIHHPWDGCTSIKLEPNEYRGTLAIVCWHCNGEKRCGCSACWQAGPGACVTCKGSGQVFRRVQ